MYWQNYTFDFFILKFGSKTYSVHNVFDAAKKTTLLAQNVRLSLLRNIGNPLLNRYFPRESHISTTISFDLVSHQLKFNEISTQIGLFSIFLVEKHVHLKYMIFYGMSTAHHRNPYLNLNNFHDKIHEINKRFTIFTSPNTL